MKLIRFCDTCIKIGFYLLFSLVPLLLTPWNYELFEYNKMMMVYGITVVVATAWLVKMIRQREIRLQSTPLDIPILLFAGSQLVSTLFSIDPHVSWLGYYSRFNGGMWSVISYVLLYYAFINNADLFIHKEEIQDTALAQAKSAKNKLKQKHVPALHLAAVPTLLKAATVTAALVAFYGILERLGIDKHLWVQDVQNRVFSTLGQPNWLAAYLIALVPVTFALGLVRIQQDKTTGTRWFLMAAYAVLPLLLFTVLLFTRSRSGLLGFIVADVIFWCLTLIPGTGAKTLESLKRLPQVKPVAVLHLLFALIVFANGTGTPAIDRFVTLGGWKNAVRTLTTKQQAVPAEATPSAVTGPALEVGGTESGVIRKYVWQAAINAWASTVKTKLIGTGTETFAFAFYQYRPAGHNQTSEWDFLYNKAHNEYLNYLATTGTLGLGSYLLLLVSYIWWFTKIVRKQLAQNKNTAAVHDDTAFTLQAALFAGWFSVLITNFFGFSVVVTQILLFLLPAISISLAAQERRIIVKALNIPGWLIWVCCIGSISLLMRIGAFWYADTLYAKGYRLVRSGSFGQAIPAFVQAISLNKNEPAYHDELGSAYATLAVAAFEGSNATQAAQLAALSVGESVTAINTSPKNVNFYKTRTKIYYTLSSLEPTFNAKAVETLKYAISLSPNDPKIYYNLAILVGREGDSLQAIANLQKAKSLKPGYRDAYYALWVFYTEIKKPAEAKAIMQEYLTNIDPNDKDFSEKVK